MNWPSLSIIIPSYNQGQYLERTLLSVLKQDYPGSVQVIVSDGGSTDSTLDVLRKYPQVVWWSAKDRGFADAVNKGLAQATGEIVAIQNSDDYYLEGAFKKAVSVLMEDAELAFVTGNDVLIGENGDYTFPPPKPYVTLFSPLSLIAEIPLYIPQHCTFIRRSAVEWIGGLREEVDYCADFDLWYRMLHFGKAVMLPDYLAAYQLHLSQRTQNKANLFINGHKKVVEDAEANPKYAQRFMPPPEMKRNRFRHWEVAWNMVAGGEEGSRTGLALAQETLQQPDLWSSHVLDIFRDYVSNPKPHSSRVRDLARTLQRRLERNTLIRALFGKLPYPRYAAGYRKEIVDLDWWQGKPPSSSVKVVRLTLAVTFLLALVQAYRVKKKSSGILKQPAAILSKHSDDTEMWPSLSIIIPSYNQGQYLERTLLSILKQDYPGSVQVIVSDGGSTDSTLDVLRKYPQVVWWSAKDRGFADAVNKGLAQATGEIVAIQSSDDYYLEGAFHKAISVLRQDPSLAFVTGADITLEENGYASMLPKPYVTLQNPGSLISRTPWLYVPQHTTFIRRAAIDQVDGLREEVDRCADFDLWYRVLHFGKAVMLADYLAVYQRHTTQRTQNKADLWVAVHKKVVEDAEANPKYARRYTPAPNHKRDIFLMWEALWNSMAGGEAEKQKARRLAQDVLSQPGQWPDYMVDYLKPFRDAPPPPSKYLNSRWGKALKRNRFVRALVGKPPLRKLVSNVSADIHWWAKGKPTASLSRASKKALRK